MDTSNLWQIPHPKLVYSKISCIVDVTCGGPRPSSHGDPAAGSGRLFEHFGNTNKFASDLRRADCAHKSDKRFFPGVDFLTHVLQPLRICKQIYIVANPPYGDLTCQFINRAFDGTYPVKRALFLVSGGTKLTGYLDRVDYSRCVLVKASKTFEAEFDIMLEPRHGGEPIYRALKQKVQLLLFYSIDEFEHIFTSPVQASLCNSIIQTGSCNPRLKFTDSIRLDPKGKNCKSPRQNAQSKKKGRINRTAQ